MSYLHRTGSGMRRIAILENIHKPFHIDNACPCPGRRFVYVTQDIRTMIATDPANDWHDTANSRFGQKGWNRLGGSGCILMLPR